MRHLSLHEILQIEEGEGTPEAVEHLASCISCRAEQSRFHFRRARLRALPIQQPPSDRWLLLERAVVRSRRVRTASWGLALAAGVGALIALPSLTRRPPPLPARTAATAPPASDQAELAELVRRSKELDDKLRTVPESQVLSIATADSVVHLEDQLAFVDQCLVSLRGRAEVEEISALWKTRIELLEALIAQRSHAVNVVL